MEKKKEITDHANSEGNGPQRSKERGRRGSTGPPQPEQRRRKHHRDPLAGVQVEEGCCALCNTLATVLVLEHIMKALMTPQAQIPEVKDSTAVGHAVYRRARSKFCMLSNCVSIYRLISMYNGSDSNMSAHTRFAKSLETLRTIHYPETYRIIHYLSPTWSAKPWNLSLTISSRGNAPPTSS